MKKVFLIFISFVIFISGCVKAPAPLMTPEDVINNQDNFLNQTIAVEGIADAGVYICSTEVCPQENPCCNECGGNLILKGSRDVIVVSGDYNNKHVSCFGNECNYDCYPLETKKKYRVTGLWTQSQFGDYFLEIESFEK